MRNATDQDMSLNRCRLVLIFAVLLGLAGCGSETGADLGLLPKPSLVTPGRPPICLSESAVEALGTMQAEPTPGALPVGPLDFAQAKFWFPSAAPSAAPASNLGLIFVTGVDGGFIEPADGIFSMLATQFNHQGVSAVFVQYRRPGELDPSLEDAQAAAFFLKAQGVSRIAILGWSFGGAVITRAAAMIPEIVTVVGFAPQSRDTVPIQDTQSILLIHSEDDENVPISASEEILAETPTGSRREFFRVAGLNHHLDGALPSLAPVVTRWLAHELSADPRCRD